MAKNIAYTPAASATYEAPDWLVKVHAEHVAHEFYRIRRYHDGHLMMDVNGGREEMTEVMREHAELYEVDMPLPHYTPEEELNMEDCQCELMYNCCDCGTDDQENGCGCRGCWSCNACEDCLD